MNNKYIAALFTCNLVAFLVGTSLLTMLPVYALELGGSESSAGVYLGLAFASLAAGTLTTGRLSRRFEGYKLIFAAGFISMVMTMLMGQAATMFALTVVTIVSWFAGGVTMALINIFTGMLADPQKRGRTFGVIGSALGVGQVIGGLVVGPIIDQWGFSTFFAIIALPYILMLIASTFLRSISTVQIATATNATPPPTGMNSGFWLLMTASILAATALLSTAFTRPLLMNSLQFDATAISSTLIVGGIVNLPLPYFIGWLADRLGRRRTLIICYSFIGAGTLVLLSSTTLAHFWLSTMLVSIGGVHIIAGSALVTDMVSREALSVALARFTATPWIGGTIGFIGAGLITEALGFQAAFLIAAVLPLVSLLLLIPIRKPVQVAPVA